MNAEWSCDIRALADLLKPEGNESPDSDEDLPNAGLSKLGPGQIGARTEKSSTNEKNFRVRTLAGGDIPDDEEDENKVAKKETKYIPNENDIWRDDELVTATCGQERTDPREQPEYDIKYKQAVTTEDIYLQMGGKNTSTASCEDMIVTIHLDGENSKNVIDLSVSKAQLDVRSPLYRLALHLPHPIEPETGNAVWDEKDRTLVVTLRMIRELDLLNF